MKHLITSLSLALCTLPLLVANPEAAETEKTLQPLEAAIAAFNNRDRSEPDERLALLTPPSATESSKPVLVTGKPPQQTQDDGLVDISEIPLDPEAADELPPSDEPEPKGLKVRVEHLHAGRGKWKPESVRLLAPFPAKALDQAPAGWLLQTSDLAPAFKRQVELAPGKAINLTIRPHVLVPDADQQQIIEVQEPGFSASLGYQQSDTVSAVLSDSIERLNEDNKRIGDAIDQLQQLIVSLPKPAPPRATAIPDAQNPIPESP